jgi:ribosomal protein S18 acetylase RimI-like enzyme
VGAHVAGVQGAGDGLRFITLEDALYAEELELRFRVLREPLGHSRDSVKFPFEDESLHLVALRGGALVGCVLFHPEGKQSGRLYQMAVKPDLQRAGMGKTLVRALEGELLTRKFERVYLHARETVVPFYERLGYAVTGPKFHEVGIPHLPMARTIG